jgi:ribonuclease J
LRCPVYCTPFTAEILPRKLAEAGLTDEVPLRVVEPGQRHQLGSFEVQWIHLTHSTPESQALLLQTPVGRVLHTGDWKLDPEPVVGPGTNPATLQHIGDTGVLALVCDSTNAMVPDRSVSEGALYAGLLEKVRGATGRVVIACFGSNVARLVTLARQLGVPRQLNGRNGDLFMLAPQPGIRRAAEGMGRVTLER